MAHYSILFAIAAICCFAAGCSKQGPVQQSESKKWLSNGQIVISRPVPQVSAPGSLNMLGFVPVIGGHTGVWLSIDLKSTELTLMDGSRVVSKAAFEGGGTVPAGSYQVLHMQRSPLWYAPDSYFTTRNISVPPQGDKARYRRGALGEYAIFINKETPIHSGPVWSDDVGGIRIPESDMAKIYNQLQVGSIIDVK